MCSSLLKTMVSLLAAFLLVSVARHAHAADKVDLGSGVSFERYLRKAGGEQIETLWRRIDAVQIPSELLDAILRIDRPTVVVVYSSLTCPDCGVVVPMVEAICRRNALISSRYFERTPQTRELLIKRTGVSRVPTVFIADAEGHLGRNSYAEFPASLRDAVDECEDDDRKKELVSDFRSGKHDEETIREIVQLLLEGVE